MSIIVGTPNNDFLLGTSSDDLIDGGAGNDTLLGGAGDDTFKGGQGNDSLNGGVGFDTADYSNLGKSITLSGVGTIIKAGGLGTDTVFQVERVVADATVANNTIDASQSLPGVAAIADLEAQTISALNVPGLGTLTFNVVNFDNVIGTINNDTIKGDAQNNLLSGLDGNDLIDGRGGNDTLLGGAGDDTFNGGQGNDSINGGVGFDTADYSNLGKSITLSGVGTIIKAGGLGTDTVFQVERVVADATVANNTIDASQSLPGVAAIADLEAQTISALNVPGLGTLTFKVVNFDNVIGTINDDIIKGDAQNNLLSGLDGNDLIDGRGGNDTLLGGAGDDTFKGGQGNDSINGGVGFDIADYSNLGKSITLSGVGTITKAGGLGTDTVFQVERVVADATVANNTIDASQSLPGVAAIADLEAQTISALNVPGLGTLTFNVVNFDNVIGTINNDTIKGDAQNNQLFGLGGNDLIDGRGGNDLIDGGQGDDTIKGGQGNDSIDGGDGQDTVDYSLSGGVTVLPTGTVQKSGGGADQLIRIEKIIGSATAIDTIDASGTNVQLIGDLSAQQVNVSNIPGFGSLNFGVVNFDNLTGGNGNDRLTGNAGANTLNGGSGDDNLDGRDGNDILIGGLGKDILAGGAGADIFRYNSALEGGDIINDLNASQGDKIQVSASGFGGQLQLGLLQASQFTLGSAFTNTNQRFAFNTNGSILSFDRDGSGSQFGSVEIARINGVNSPQIIEVIA
ncbi:beta strand repeat-containing protein [Nostoc sp.]